MVLIKSEGIVCANGRGEYKERYLQGESIGSFDLDFDLGQKWYLQRLDY
jgi:hypothetical protein